MRKVTKMVVLLVPMPDMDIDTTTFLLKLRGSSSRHNIAVNWLTTRRVQLQTCSVETLTSISPLELYGDIEVEITTTQAAGFCN